MTDDEVCSEFDAANLTLPLKWDFYDEDYDVIMTKRKILLQNHVKPLWFLLQDKYKSPEWHGECTCETTTCTCWENCLLFTTCCHGDSSSVSEAQSEPSEMTRIIVSRTPSVPVLEHEPISRTPSAPIYIDRASSPNPVFNVFQVSDHEPEPTDVWWRLGCLKRNPSPVPLELLSQRSFTLTDYSAEVPEIAPEGEVPLYGFLYPNLSSPEPTPEPTLDIYDSPYDGSSASSELYDVLPPNPSDSRNSFIVPGDNDRSSTFYTIMRVLLLTGVKVSNDYGGL